MLFTLNTFTARDNEEWSEKALGVLDEYEMQNQYGKGAEYNSIIINSLQGKKLNCGIENSLDTHDIFLFLVSNQTHLLGKIMQREFHCDFILLKFEAPMGEVKTETLGLMGNLDVNMTDDDVKAIVEERRVYFSTGNEKRSSSVTDQQLQILKEEKIQVDLEN
jgi:hypothetical protein